MVINKKRNQNILTSRPPKPATCCLQFHNYAKSPYQKNNDVIDAVNKAKGLVRAIYNFYLNLARQTTTQSQPAELQPSLKGFKFKNNRYILNLLYKLNCNVANKKYFKITSKNLGLNPRSLGINSRSLGLNPRKLGTNPKSIGTNTKKLQSLKMLLRKINKLN